MYVPLLLCLDTIAFPFNFGFVSHIVPDPATPIFYLLSFMAFFCLFLSVFLSNGDSLTLFSPLSTPRLPPPPPPTPPPTPSYDNLPSWVLKLWHMSIVLFPRRSQGWQ